MNGIEQSKKLHQLYTKDIIDKEINNFIKKK